MSYRQDPRNQYYNNGSGNQSGSYQGYSNPRMQNDGYRSPIRNPYSTPNPNIRGPPRGRIADDDDTVSVVSSVYSQPSVAGFSPPNNTRYYQEQSLETTDPRRQSLLYNEYDYTLPPSPFAGSTNTHNSTTRLTEGSSQQGLPLIDQNENNYMMDNTEEDYYQERLQDIQPNYYQDPSQDPQPNYYQDPSQDTQQNYYQDPSQDTQQDYYQDPSQDTQQDYYQDPSQDTQQDYYQDHLQNTQPNYYQDHSQNTQPQFDVYNDFNNNFQNNEKYDEESRNNTLTGPDGSHDLNPYAMNDDRDFSGNGKDGKGGKGGKGTRQSMAGDHYVVNPKKGRKCALCSRKTCVIITFTILVLLAAGMYFVWPRIPIVNPLLTPPPTPLGDGEITINPARVKMQMGFQLELDNRENWLPYKFNSFNINVLDVVTLKSIGSGVKKGFSIPGRAKSTITIPVSIDYSGSPQGDGILQNFIDSCTQPQQHSLKLRFETTMLILGLDWIKKPTASIPVLDFPCPFNLTRPSDGTTPPADQSGQSSPTPEPPAPAPTPAAGTPNGGTPTPGQQPAPGASAQAPPAGAPAQAPPAGAPAPTPAPGAPAQAPPAGAPAPTPAPGAPAPAPGQQPAAGAPAPAPGG